ncbi:hypothetical protein MSPP1_000890 [Malassezia sp. CBS 17886]|nr:hypothetical protein MSPP1_000890 [Malassezia sp. CBS 17886]
MFFTRSLLLIAAALAGASAAPAHNAGARSSKVFQGGHATWYSASESQGNCGWWSTNADHIVALNTQQYGSTNDVSNHCGRVVRIVNGNNNKAVHAIVADSCPTCSHGSLDLSKGLFSALTDGDLGQGVFPISWSFLN